MEFPGGLFLRIHIATEHKIINIHTKWAMNFADMFLVSYFVLKNHLHRKFSKNMSLDIQG